MMLFAKLRGKFPLTVHFLSVVISQWKKLERCGLQFLKDRNEIFPALQTATFWLNYNRNDGKKDF